jgi:hypothetical protein
MFLDIPKAVLDRMTKTEVRIIIDDVKTALADFDVWNEDRPEVDHEPARPWQDVPPPRSLDEYSWRVRARR